MNPWRWCLLAIVPAQAAFSQSLFPRAEVEPLPRDTPAARSDSASTLIGPFGDPVDAFAAVASLNNATNRLAAPATSLEAAALKAEAVTLLPTLRIDLMRGPDYRALRSMTRDEIMLAPDLSRQIAAIARSATFSRLTSGHEVDLRAAMLSMAVDLPGYTTPGVPSIGRATRPDSGAARAERTPARADRQPAAARPPRESPGRSTDRAVRDRAARPAGDSAE